MNHLYLTTPPPPPVFNPAFASIASSSTPRFQSFSATASTLSALNGPRTATNAALLRHTTPPSFASRMSKRARSPSDATDSSDHHAKRIHLVCSTSLDQHASTNATSTGQHSFMNEGTYRGAFDFADYGTPVTGSNSSANSNSSRHGSEDWVQDADGLSIDSPLYAGGRTGGGDGDIDMDMADDPMSESVTVSMASSSLYTPIGSVSEDPAHPLNRTFRQHLDAAIPSPNLSYPSTPSSASSPGVHAPHHGQHQYNNETDIGHHRHALFSSHNTETNSSSTQHYHYFTHQHRIQEQHHHLHTSEVTTIPSHLQHSTPHQQSQRHIHNTFGPTSALNSTLSRDATLTNLNITHTTPTSYASTPSSSSSLTSTPALTPMPPAGGMSMTISPPPSPAQPKRRVVLGPRAGCEKCRLGVKGHFVHYD